MPHNLPVPDDERLERLITRAYEFMPAPERSRLDLVEGRLVRKLRTVKPQRIVNTNPWWIVLLITGGLAAAAWWAGGLYNDVFNGKDNGTINQKEGLLHPADVPADRALPPAPERDVPGNESGRKESPVIYQREP